MTSWIWVDHFQTRACNTPKTPRAWHRGRLVKRSFPVVGKLIHCLYERTVRVWHVDWRSSFLRLSSVVKQCQSSERSRGGSDSGLGPHLKFLRMLTPQASAHSVAGHQTCLEPAVYARNHDQAHVLTCRILEMYIKVLQTENDTAQRFSRPLGKAKHVFGGAPSCFTYDSHLPLSSVTLALLTT